MEKNSGFGYHHHHNPYMMSPNPSLLGFPNNTNHLYTELICENPHSRNAPSFPFSGLQHSNANEPNNSRNWLYNMPHFHNAFPPVFNFGQPKIPAMGPTPPQKKFLVFDQSSDKTTFIYNSPGPHTLPIQFRAPDLLTPHNMTKDEFRVCSNPLNPSTNDENIDDNSKEYEEDSDELDALLCSDGDFSEDDEETSTGHSPSTMTDDGVRDSVDETGEEVDSSYTGPAKRRRILDGPLLEDDDALSICGGDVDDRCSKRMRREKIHETLSALRSVIPNVEGNDAVVVIDEAIRYLRSLKDEAKALGLDDAL